jgi:hypothetical protein
MNTETEQIRAVRAALHELVADVNEPPNELARLRSGLRAEPKQRRWARPRVLVPVGTAAAAAAIVGGLLLAGQQDTGPSTGPVLVLASAERSDPAPSAAAALNECVAITEQQISEGTARGDGMVPVPATGWHVDAALGADLDAGILLAHNENGDIGGCELDHGKGLGLQDAHGSGMPAGKVFTVEFGWSGGEAAVTQVGGRIASDISRVEVGTRQGTPVHTQVQVALGRNSWAARIGRMTSAEAAELMLRFYDGAGELVYVGPLSYT